MPWLRNLWRNDILWPSSMQNKAARTIFSAGGIGKTGYGRIERTIYTESCSVVLIPCGVKAEANANTALRRISSVRKNSWSGSEYWREKVVGPLTLVCSFMYLIPFSNETCHADGSNEGRNRSIWCFMAFESADISVALVSSEMLETITLKGCQPLQCGWRIGTRRDAGNIESELEVLNLRKTLRKQVDIVRPRYREGASFDTICFFLWKDQLDAHSQLGRIQNVAGVLPSTPNPVQKRATRRIRYGEGSPRMADLAAASKIVGSVVKVESSFELSGQRN
ncbi:hypothetical protein BDN70DRAFT_966970 [Pholiota conissans]|uniref:Uncharacterized protein n=1 Tax=Pholiota conissans TaxID=109636 RepID=A0A9P6CUC2_9AGAR|nr:hypothetical protein BDN70DRAFT_966970 [Pholiota conissans]